MMKRTVSVALLVTLVFTACFPGFAQKERYVRESVKSRTQFARLSAISDGVGVLVQWEMAVERSTVGFYIDRVSATDNDLDTLPMVAGSLARYSDKTTFGGRYQLFDAQGDVNTQYVIRGVSLDGTEVASKPVGVSVVKDVEAETGVSRADWFETADISRKTRAGGDMDLHPELRQLVTESLQTPDLTTHRWVVGQPGVKIAVRKEGLYRVTAGELAAAGFNIESGTSGWRLFAEGVEQAITVDPGGAFLEFYGKPIDTVESDTRVYYLIDGATPGKRIETRVLRPIGGPSFSTNYPLTTIKKERNTYVNTLHNGPAENYWGRLISSAPTTYTFNLTGVELSGNITFTIKLQGYITQGSHLVRLILNGTEIPSVTWVGETAKTATFELPATRLVEGNNNLEMTGMNPGDFSLFDSISIAHKRRYEAEQNRINFFTPGYRKVDLTGFTSQNVRVYDTTVDGSPRLLSNLPVTQNGATYKVTLPSSRNFVGFAIDESSLLVSPSVTANAPSNYFSSTQPYDLIIISHSASAFLSAAESWADYRRNQGFTAKIVDVADIFDEFNYGSASADAIKAFLNHAYTNWTQAPKYVMFMGDASHDPKNYEGFGNWDLVPSKNVDLELEETASDEALADFNADGVAEIAVGRIPARNVATINNAFSKTMTFETQPNQNLSRGALFAYDIPTGWDFGGTSVQLADQLPSGMPKVFVDRQSPNAQATLISELNSGKYIANYAGHGSLGLWASSSFFSSSSVPLLTNVDNPTFFTMLTCLNGYFIIPAPNFDSLSEHLLKSSAGGAAATWASTAKTTPDIQTLMGVRFYNKLGEGQINRVGDLVEDAKNAIPIGDVRYSWVLLGDPMLKMR